MYYYLRKEPYEATLPIIEKTDSTVVPERKYMTDDRALYKARGMSRFYRSEYPVPSIKSVIRYRVKTLTTILKRRADLHNYCGEWFDVYDENGKVDLTNVVICTKSFLVEACDDNGFTVPNKTIAIKSETAWTIDTDSHRIMGGEIRLTRDNAVWIEIPNDYLQKFFKPAIIKGV